jgi:O-antigen ligase
MMTTDELRNPFDVVPGGSVDPRNPGPATALVFDLLTTIPALLALARRAIDGSYPLRFRWSPLLFVLLGILCAGSSFWASDKFAALVSGLQVVTAAVVLWSMSQLVRSWPQFRLVAAVAGGLLLVLVAQSMVYKFVELPEHAKFWAEHGNEALKAQNLAPGSFGAKQFEHKFLSGELIGFFVSANTFAAVGVMLFAACVGIGFFRFRAGDNPNWLIASGIAAAALIWELIQARSKTSAVTPVYGVGVVAIWALFSHRLRHARGRTFLAGLGFVAVCTVAVIGIGVHYGHLFEGRFSNSLDFRWKYWTASAGVFKDHPWIGVGYDNFGPFYLAHRRPEAAEEVIDPHNLVVRCFTELGVVGGLLLLAWMARLGWELMGPADDFPDSTDRPPTTREPILIAVLATIVGLAATIDFDFPLFDQLWGTLPWLIYGLVLLFGSVAGSLLEPTTESIDPRPAKWIYTCLATGLGLFLVANMIDFSWREPGALMTFAGLAGAAVGMTETRAAARLKSKALPVALAASAGIAWLVAAVAVVLPIIEAESTSATADEVVLGIDPKVRDNSGDFRHAIELYRQAADAVPYNAAYRFRVARMELLMGDRNGIKDMTAAIAANPTRIRAWLTDADARLAEPVPDQAAVIRDFDTAVRLDPNDVDIRRRYGDALEKFHRHDEAVEQYRAALAANDALPADEPKRLPPDRLAALKKLALVPTGE